MVDNRALRQPFNRWTRSSERTLTRDEVSVDPAMSAYPVTIQNSFWHSDEVGEVNGDICLSAAEALALADVLLEAGLLAMAGSGYQKAGT